MSILTKTQIVDALLSSGEDRELLYRRAAEVKRKSVGEGVYLRGLIEYSNVCAKNCYYCGIRRDHTASMRYTLTEQQVLEAAQYAYQNRYGSVVLQSGESDSKNFVDTITKLIKEIKKLSNNELGITLSLGEQSQETYRKWFDAGAHRYLLRIESSDKELYKKLHPKDEKHLFEERIEALQRIKAIGYQLGTGVMMGLPYQRVESLAEDLLFMKQMDIDMCGMGPYIVAKGTPLALKVVEDKEGRFDKESLSEEQIEAGVIHSKEWRLETTYKMIALLRILMPDINIAATTALQAIDPQGRIRAIEVGANVIMPNLTPYDIRSSYALYDDKPLTFDSHLIEKNIKYGEWGDSRHFYKREKDEI